MNTSRRDAIGGLAAATALSSAAIARSVPPATRKDLFWAACTTPCDKNLKVDLAAMRDQVQWYKQNGADGVTILGSTGEFASFSTAERRAVMETVGKAKGNMSVLCTSGTCNIPETVELSKHAADHGADGVIVVPPFYYKNPSSEGLLRYYSLMMDALPRKLAVYLYHVPHWSQVPISNDLVNGLKQRSNLKGIKYSEDTLPDYAKFIKDFPGLNIITGSLTNAEYALQHGMGCILQEAGPFCRQIAEMFAAARAGKDFHAAFAQLNALMAKHFGHDEPKSSYGLMQYAMTVEMGRPQSYQRPPFVDLSDARKAQLQREFART